MKRRYSERGSQLVELAIVTPLLMLVFAGIAESGMFFRSVEIAQNAAREGARIAVLPGGEANNYAMVQTRVSDYIAQSGLTGTVTVTATPTTIPITAGLNAAGVQVTVTYTYDCQFLGPVIGLMNGIFNPTWTYQTGALMRTQIAAVAP
jgi:Flp pilus assembly protein TadG